MKKYRCQICGAIVEVEEGEACPVCGADFEFLEPVEDKNESK